MGKFLPYELASSSLQLGCRLRKQCVVAPNVAMTFAKLLVLPSPNRSIYNNAMQASFPSAGASKVPNFLPLVVSAYICG